MEISQKTSKTKLNNTVNIYLALIHYPVLGKSGEIIASAITNLDLHDIARLAKTYGVKSFYVITPIEEQKMLAQKIVSHWVYETGLTRNPIRAKALELIKIKNSLQEAIDDIYTIEKAYPKTIGTCAKKYDNNINYENLKKLFQESQSESYLINFGTSWGLSEGLISQMDYVLEPIMGVGDYNHLSVRCASAIILDRLLKI